MGASGRKTKSRRKAKESANAAPRAPAAPQEISVKPAPTEASSSPPGRRWPSVFIGGFLLVQIALPVEYYACRQDRYDERFAWRMFSPERMTQCGPQFTMGEARNRVVLGSKFHQAWIETAKRGRVEVITRMAESLCERNPGQPVYVDLTCVEIDGSEVQRIGGWNMCDEVGE